MTVTAISPRVSPRTSNWPGDIDLGFHSAHHLGALPTAIAVEFKVVAQLSKR